MREILFRGKRIDNGEWVQGDLVQDRDLKQYSIEYCDYYYDADGLQREYCGNEVIPETVGQFTGLTDKNENKIFEGDIVDILTEDEEIGIVVYDDGGFQVEADGFCVDFHSNINGTDLEVIGNIHDNPELIGGGEGG